MKSSLKNGPSPLLSLEGSGGALCREGVGEVAARERGWELLRGWGLDLGGLPGLQEGELARCRGFAQTADTGRISSTRPQAAEWTWMWIRGTVPGNEAR